MDDITVPPIAEPAPEPAVPPAAAPPPAVVPPAAPAPLTPVAALAPADDTERVLAAVAHIFGWISAAIVMLVAQKRSAYLRFHALQALAFDLALLLVNTVVGFVVGGLFAVLWVGVVMSLAARSGGPGPGPGSAPPAELIPVFLMFPLFGLCMGTYSLGLLVLRIVAAVRGYSGQVYAYPLIERWLKP
jgi:uncharacterized membrane protein